MKKIIVLLLLCFLVGCQEQLVSKSGLQKQLVKSPADWIEKYGDSLESQQTANIALAIQVINRQGNAIKQLDSRLVKLEGVADPNGVK